MIWCPGFLHGPLTRYGKLRVAHVPGMPGTFFPPPWVSYPDMRHGTRVTHMPWCMMGSITSGLVWSRWRGKRSRHSRRMRNPQFSLFCKRPMTRSTLINDIDRVIGTCSHLYRSRISTAYVLSVWMDNMIQAWYVFNLKQFSNWMAENFYRLEFKEEIFSITEFPQLQFPHWQHGILLKS